ncbi:sulfite exporter TauE/SafE family protein [Vibrio sp. S9_S30]|uniref:sulfite exporter TauE/SafE family protein n=1 Tax=Vibrio sp. S9_S30 TaxID=2720226 RepID=UPI0016812F6B|nr:sulfite exporter TauE/SafE family protein [Vibrio sp. S9_S30]MBD1559398.1 sulfite exporter TauE/SafE family protein [Vibrio sp. S9_S30]
MNIELIFQFLVLGSIVGVLAGLLGIGGGLIVVPAMLWLLPAANISTDLIMHIALATSLATIILTSGSSAFNHLRLGNVDMFVVKWLMPGVVVGGLAGSFIAEAIPTQYLINVFGIIVLGLAIQMLMSLRSAVASPMPSAGTTLGYGGLIGVVSSLAGIGGGSLTVPFLSRHGVDMRKAIGSSSVCGSAIALAGMVGFVVHGFEVQGLPKYSLGYVYLPALFGIVATSVLTTRIGAKWATKLPTAVLKKIFAVFLLFIAGKMLLPI